MDIQKQIEYWCTSSDEDWEVAAKLVKDGSIRHGLFFAHLALEKRLKALVCQNTQDIAPRIHNLPRLCQVAGLTLKPDHTDILADMNQFNIEGRYPEFHISQPSQQEALGYLTKSEEVLLWLTHQLSK
jgi:HEPN domain-containing protein